MRVLVMSKEGDGLGVAQRLAYEGNQVDVFIQDKNYDTAGRGIVGRVDNWKSASRRADFIMSDCVGFGRLEDVVRASNKPMLGFCATLDRLELDRSLGMQAFTTAGIDIPETHEFASRKDAARIPKELGWRDGWVIKPSNNRSNALTMLVKDEALYERALSRLPEDSNGILQRVCDGIEVSTEGWFNGRGWVRPFNHTFEEKKLLAGNLGPTTGCMGNVVVNAGTGDKLTRATVERLEGLLRHIGYRGPVDVNCIVDEHHAYALEFTSRMGYDAIEALIEGLDEPCGDFFYEIATGSRTSMKLTDDVMIAVRLTTPARSPAGEPILGINDQSLPHLFLSDVCHEDGKYFTAATDHCVLKATAIGRVKPGSSGPNGIEHKPDYTYEVRRRVYRALDRIQVHNKQYRVDIGERVNSDIAKLKAWGWL